MRALRPRWRLSRHLRLWRLCAAGVLQSTASLHAQPAPSTNLEPASLWLEVRVNQRSSELVEVVQRGPHFEIEADTLRRLHVLNDQPAGTLVAVDRMPGVSLDYDALGQQLQLQVPAQWLPVQQLGAQAPARALLSESTGFVLNYDLYTLHTQGRATVSLWSEQRLFGDLGVLSQTGISRWGSPAHDTHYLRYDTRWTQTQHDQATERHYGDIATGALRWSNSVRLGGVQWTRNFAVRPDLITYPVPQFAGQAALPSAVDVFVNGFRAMRQEVQAGPFTVGDLPVVSGAGEASVVTTDALGRQVYTTVPFYVSPELLRRGLTDYSASIGALRRDYGLRSFSYGQTLAAGVLRHGVSDSFTVEGQTQVGRGLRVLGLGGLVGLGSWGMADASLTRGHVERTGSGWQYSMGYQYQHARGSVSLQQIGRTAGYGDAATYANDGFELPRRLRQINLSWNVRRGALNLGWISQVDGTGQRNRLAFAGYTTAIGARAFLSLSAGRSLEDNNNQVRLQLSYLLDSRSTAQVATERTQGGTRGHLNYQRNMPSDGGWGWNLGYAAGQGNRYQQASLQYRNPYVLVQGGLYGLSGQQTQWGQLTGAVGAMDGYVFAANRINDGFALVSTQGTADVPVRYDNELVGRTNAQGYLLVPSVPSYYPVRYAIDPLELPIDVHVPNLERQATVARGRGTLIELPVIRARTATITVVDTQGEPLAAGARVVHAPGNNTTVVGWDGVVYLTELHAQNRLQITPAVGPACAVHFSATQYHDTPAPTLVCQPSAALPAAPTARELP